ncbi:MAG: PD-(D/E)XK nuclease family protein, partial [Pirellulales bacterium]|nr:PD-(D/E)XK nuclease family protein [Pirellulales bacterium]
ALGRKRVTLAAMVRSPRYGVAGQSLLDGIEAVASRGDRRTFGAFEGLFSSDAVRAILERKYGPEHLWSPSKLETYAACPFRFFAENVLSLTPAPELALESDLARRGSVLHDTLARLYARLNAAAEEGGPAPTPTPQLIAQRFQETLDAIVGSRPRRGLDGALREVERRQIAGWAEKFSRQHDDYDAAWRHLDSPLVPTYFEARFGPKHRRSESLDDASLSTEKPFELDVSGERMRFTGQIDRIDVGRVGDALVFNVIDYKTSASARVKTDDVRAGLQIQLPLYAMAAAELLLADKQAAALSAGYWSIRGKGFAVGARSGGPLAIGEIRDGKVEVAAGWTQLRQELLARIAEIVGGIRRGAFPVFNADHNCGQFCPLSTGCRIGHVRSLEKTWPTSDLSADVADSADDENRNSS